MQTKFRLRSTIAASVPATYCLILASCTLRPGDYTPVTDSTAFGPHTLLHDIYYCGSDAKNHYFTRDMKPWWASSHYFKIDKSLIIYEREKPFSPRRAQWDSVPAPPRFLNEKTSAWPISRRTPSPAITSSATPSIERLSPQTCIFFTTKPKQWGYYFI